MNNAFTDKLLNDYKKNEEKTQSHQQQLFTKIQNQKQHRKKDVPSVSSSTSSVDYKTLYRQIKKEKKQVEQQLEHVKESSRIHQQQDTLSAKKLEEKQKQNFSLSQENAELKRRIRQLERDLHNQQTLHSEQGKQMELLAFEKEQTRKHAQQLKEKLNTATSKRLSYRELLKRVQIKQRVLRQNVKQYKQTISNQNDRILSLETRVTHLSHINVDAFLLHFIEHMTLDTIDQYQRMPELIKRYGIVQSAVRLTNTPTQRNGLSSPYENVKTSLFNYQFGFVTPHPIGKDKWQFVNTENRVFDVMSHPNYPLHDGVPVSAVVREEDQTAYVGYVYDNQQEFEQDHRLTVTKKVRLPRSEKPVRWQATQPFTVLIVTSKNGIRYRNRLAEHGVSATWLDPYEKNTTHIKRTASSYDIVLLLEDAMPHSERHLIDTYQPVDAHKIQTMYYHNEDTIVARVRYAAIQKGLLTIEANEQVKEKPSLVCTR